MLAFAELVKWNTRAIFAKSAKPNASNRLDTSSSAGEKAMTFVGVATGPGTRNATGLRPLPNDVPTGNTDSPSESKGAIQRPASHSFLPLFGGLQRHSLFAILGFRLPISVAMSSV